MKTIRLILYSSALLWLVAGQAQPACSPGVRSYSYADTLADGGVCVGFVAEADFAADSSLRFRAVAVLGGTTPSHLYDSLERCGLRPVVVANAGFFDMRTREPLGLVVSGGEVISPERQRMRRRDAKDSLRIVYPIHAAFGQRSDGGFEAQWVYSQPEAGGWPYAYPFPYNNDDSTRTYAPAAPVPGYLGSAPWQCVEALGAGPMLVLGGRNVSLESSLGELYYRSIGGRARHPRTAIGVTREGRLIVVVADGRGMNGSAGCTLAELADKMISLGAVDAINLDGGGSSAMVVAGRVVNRPSGSGRGERIVERVVPTFAVIVREP